MRRFRVFVIVVSVAALSAGPSRADTIIPFLSQPNGGDAYTNNYNHVGDPFSIPAGTTTKVNRLGFWDKDGDGLTQSHVVAISTYSPITGDWTILSRAVIPAGTIAPLQDGYRWVPVPEITLAPTFGNAFDYAVIFDVGGDEWRFGTAGSVTTANPSFNATISLVNAFYAQFPPLAIPDVGGTIANVGNYSATGAQNKYYVGGNIGFEAVIVPEPSSMAVLLFGAIALMPFSRWRKRVC